MQDKYVSRDLPVILRKRGIRGLCERAKPLLSARLLHEQEFDTRVRIEFVLRYILSITT